MTQEQKTLVKESLDRADAKNWHCLEVEISTPERYGRPGKQVFTHKLTITWEETIIK